MPDGCFATTDGSRWNTECANGRILERPRMQLWHGTADDVLRYPNFGEEVDQWTNVHRLTTTPTSTDYPQPNWTRRRYSDKVEAISLQNVGHNLMAAGMALRAVQFFGLDHRM